MNCEICGKPISGKPIRAKIDGSVMLVCRECSKFGKIQKEPPKPRYLQSKKSSKKGNSNKKSRREEPTEELIEDYGITIRKARESKNLSREQLGETIYEKVSVINRLESEKMVPDLKLAKKIENTLNIKLIEKVDDFNLDSYKFRSSGANTIGNLVKIKRK